MANGDGTAPLEFRFRPTNRLAHPLTATPTGSVGLLLRVSRTRSADGIPNPWCTAVEGVVTTSARFRGRTTSYRGSAWLNGSHSLQDKSALHQWLATSQNLRTLATRRTNPTRLFAPCRASSKATVRAEKLHYGSLCRSADRRCVPR